MAEVLAAHYLQAYRSAADDSDAAQLRTEAIAALRRGAQRAAAVGAPQTAERAYRTAIDLAAERGGAHRSGRGGRRDGASRRALRGLARAVRGRRRRGSASSGATGTRLVSAPRSGRRSAASVAPRDAIDRMRHDLDLLSDDVQDPDAAQINVELGVALLSAGRVREAAEPLERALELAQALELPSVLASALTYKAQLCDAVGRVEEARILFDGAIALCQPHELTDRLFVAELNGGDFLRRFDLPGAAERTSDALATARRIGSRYYESVAASNLMRGWEYAGAWDDVERLGVELLEARPRAARGRDTSTSSWRCWPLRAGTHRPRASTSPGWRPGAGARPISRAGPTPHARRRSRSRPATPPARSTCCPATMRRDHRDRRAIEPGQSDRLSVRARSRARPRTHRRGGRPPLAAGRPPPRPRPAVPAGAPRPRRRPARRGRRATSRRQRRSSASRSSGSARWPIRTGSRVAQTDLAGRAARRPAPRRSPIGVGGRDRGSEGAPRVAGARASRGTAGRLSIPARS